jgi:hypothetical protein
MTKSAFSKTVFAVVSALALICVPQPASARHNGGSKGSGSFHGSGSHGGSSHGGGASHGSGHSGFSGSKHSYSVSRGGGHATSARLDSWGKNSGRMEGGSHAKSAGFSPRASGNLARGSFSGNERFGFSSGSRNFGGFGSSQSVAQGPRGSTGSWQSFGNSSGRSMLASARTSGNVMGAGWHAFGNVSRGGGTNLSRGSASALRTDSQWRSFENSRNSTFARNNAGFSSFRTSRETESNLHSAGFGFGSNRFSRNSPGSNRFSSFPSGRSIGNFGGSRFAVSGFGGSDFEQSSFGGSGLSSSFIGSGASLIPNLLGGFLNVGTSIFGGPGLLAANALSLAVRLFVSGLGANGFGQGDAAGSNADVAPGGFGGNFGFEAFPVRPACGPMANYWGTAPAWSGYCTPYAYRPFGWNANVYLGDPRIGFSYR